MSLRQVGGGLLMVSVVLLLLAAFTDAWWTLPGETKAGGCGLLGVTEALGSFDRPNAPQEHTSYSDLLDKSSHQRADDDLEMLMWLGRVTFALTLLTCASMAAVLLRVLTSQHVFYTWVTFVGAFAAVLAIAFVVSAGDLRKAFSFGSDFYLFWTGIAFAIIGERMVIRASVLAASAVQQPAILTAPGNVFPMEVGRAAQTDTRVVAAQEQQRMSPACSQCAAPTSWISEHGRFFCSRCNAYL